MRRPNATILLVPIVLLVAVLGLGPAAHGADDATTTTAVPSGDIIPEPNSGQAPDDAGDRGGALQTALFVGMMVAVVGIGGGLVVQSRRARADRGW